MATKMQVMVGKSVSVKLDYVDFGICLCQKSKDVVSSPRYLIEVTEAFLDIIKISQAGSSHGQN